MRPGLAETARSHHGIQRRFDGATRIGEESRDPGEGLVLLGVKDMQDRADQQRMGGLFPMVALFERAFGIDQHICDPHRSVAGELHQLAAQPNIREREFRRFIEGRAVQNIAAFLVANITFAEGEDVAARIGELAANTLAYHLSRTQVDPYELFGAEPPILPLGAKPFDEDG